MQINRWLYLSSQPLWISLRGKWFRKRIDQPEKCTFIATNNWIVSAIWLSVKYFFASDFPLFRKSGGEKKKKGNYKGFCFSNKSKKDNSYKSDALIFKNQEYGLKNYAFTCKSLIDFNEAFTHYNELQFFDWPSIVVHSPAGLIYTTYGLVIMVHRSIQVNTITIGNIHVKEGLAERYFFFSWGSHGAGKNEFVSQFTCSQPHLYVKIHVTHTHISTRKWW